MACVHCAGCISSVLDAGFCLTCGQPGHTACRRVPESGATDLCTECGARFDAAAQERLEAELAEAKRAATPKSLDPDGSKGHTEPASHPLRLLNILLIVFLSLCFYAAQNSRHGPPVNEAHRIYRIVVACVGFIAAIGGAVVLVLIAIRQSPPDDS
jgi:hypothetical protein